MMYKNKPFLVDNRIMPWVATSDIADVSVPP